MALKFDDFLSKKKEPTQVLDLSRVKITSKEEFKKYFDKIPEYKIKPEKVLPETIKIRDKDFNLTPSRREGRVPEYTYLDPTPPDMKGVNLTDLCPVSIDWKMLTTLRPKTKQEEDMFSRLVQLGKLELKYQQRLKRCKDSDWIRRTKSPRSSIVETRVLSCKECGEDFCDSSQCGKLMYENFFRIQPSVATGVVKDASLEGGDEGEKRVRKHRRRGRNRSRGVRRRKPRKNSIFNRPASRGCNRDHSKRERHAAGVVAGRSVSHDRGRPTMRHRSVSPPLRAKSAPRIHFKGLSSDEEAGRRGRKKRSYASVSQSDYSSQSESESQSRKVDFDDDDEKGKTGGKPRRPFVRNCTLCESSQQAVSPRSNKEYGETTTDDSDSSPSPQRQKKLLPAATIQLEFNPDVSYTKPPGPTKGMRSSTAVRRSQSVQQQQQEVRDLVKGLSTIELAFADDEVEEPRARVRRRLRVQKSARPKTTPSKISSSYLQGRGLLGKKN